MIDLQICMHVSDPNNFGAAARSYLAEVVSHLYISEDDIHVAGVDFASSYNVRWYLDNYVNALSDAQNFQFSSGTGNIMRCFEAVPDVFGLRNDDPNVDPETIIRGDRAFAPNYLLIITDSVDPNSLTDLIAARDNALSYLRVVAAVGFQGADFTQLSAIATETWRVLLTPSSYDLVSSGYFDTAVDGTAATLCADGGNGTRN